MISGAYSLSRQAIHLGPAAAAGGASYVGKAPGRVYLPLINWILLSVVLLLVIWFGSSNALASAYGIAVNGTMVMTCLLAFIVVRKVWGWSLPGDGGADCSVSADRHGLPRRQLAQGWLTAVGFRSHWAA